MLSQVPQALTWVLLCIPLISQPNSHWEPRGQVQTWNWALCGVYLSGIYLCEVYLCGVYLCGVYLHGWWQKGNLQVTSEPVEEEI